LETFKPCCNSPRKNLMIEILEITVCIAALIWACYTLFSSVYLCSNPNKCNKNCKCYE
jgi:hypothetical protein